ncbi:MAG TPA: glycoside hydrolase family 5 protein, partial [Anaerolineales bacterium]|nr:glycoside hydrolase family 5 protein [Anaerolineales bacterium]
MKHFSFRGFSLALRFLTILLCLIAFVPGAFPTALAQSNRTSLQPAATTSLGFHISGRFVLDANGNNFIMRGINVPHNWYPEQTSQFQHVKAKGANTVRVVLSSGQLWPKNSASDVANVINLCKTNKLVCVLEVHDTTGYGESAGAVSLAQAVAYWKEIKSVLIGQEAYVIINIGNEPYGNINATGWINDTKNAIAEMRTAGFQHMLMVDGPDWGQDWEFIMRDNAASVFNSDPNRNILFSIHMYGIFNTASKIQSYLSTFVNAGLPIAVGEFGHEHSDGNPDEDSIFSITQANGIGYLGWMWSGGSGAGTLDMVTNFNPNQETWWGTRIIHGPNGIAATSQEASVYSGISPTVYTISGNVETRGITLSTNDGTIETALSDANGNYFITVPAGWSGTVTPSHECFTFPL